MIKKFENYNNNEYDVGDFVLLKIESDIGTKSGKIEVEYYECEIIKKITYDSDSTPDFRVKSYNNSKLWVDYVQIDRRLSPEEIEIFKLKIESEKYNL